MADKICHASKWPEDVPYKISGYERPLFSMLDDGASEFPENTYTIFKGARKSFKNIRDTADRIAGFLISRGIKPQDRIAVFLPNIPLYPAIFFGILKAGATCVTCNPQYKPKELNFQLNDSGARAGVPPFTDALESIEKYKATIVVRVPTILSRLAAHPLIDKFDLSSIIACGSGAGSLPVELIKWFEEKTGTIFVD